MGNKFKIKTLKHNGVIVPTYEPRGFSIRYKGSAMKLTPCQEEMAVAWVKKLGTDYVKDRVFMDNFFKDFSKALGIEKNAGAEDFDFAEIKSWVEAEKSRKEGMVPEEKKALAETRKKLREENKEKYGYASLNGERVEISNYIVEPSSIFMGRGDHPLRGTWKQGADYSDVTLNLSPDAPTPELPSGKQWGGRVFDPETLWVAKWRDKLGGELKYVWIADSARFKQEREIVKFDKASELEQMIDKIRKHINDNLAADDVNRRKLATVAYLIDTLKMRVGDEKDKDEADTVGATTLRGCHVKIDGSTVEFDFLGKDSVRWIRTINPPTTVVSNLKLFMGKPEDQLFKGVRSTKVNDFLGEVSPGVTAKVFRTYHASKVVQDYLAKAKVKPENSEFDKKYAATMANLEAAITCNHKRKLPKTWESSLAKKVERLESLKAKLEAVKNKPPSKLNTKRIDSLNEKIKEAKLRVDLGEATRDYNLGTSLKSYIDPRHYVRWSKAVSYDWKKFYSKTLQRKFAWAEDDRRR